jgi:hypothetical protein
MKALALIVVLSVASLTATGASGKQIAQTTISGQDDIFAAGLTTNPGGTNGDLPFQVGVTGAEQLWVTAAGTVTCCDNSNPLLTSTASGFASNPFAGQTGSVITNSLGTDVPTFSSASVAFPLLYFFTDSSGAALGGLHTLDWGTSGYITAPSDAANLYFGFADALGFNGSSGTYNDNFNLPGGPPGILLTIASAPEPETWALLIAGVGLAGGALRLRGRRLSPAAA